MTETIMTNKTWLAASCAMVLLAAGPAFAQTQAPNSGATGMAEQAPAMGANNGAMSQPSDTQAGNAAMNNSSNPNATGNESGMHSNNGAMNNSSNMANDENSNGTSAMGHHRSRHMAGNNESDTSQNAAVERLNERSYQAAQQGRAFDVNGSGSSDQGSSGMGSSNPNGSGAGSMGNTGGNGTQPCGSKM
jgi:hypothetical protein